MLLGTVIDLTRWGGRIVLGNALTSPPSVRAVPREGFEGVSHPSMKSSVFGTSDIAIFLFFLFVTFG